LPPLWFGAFHATPNSVRSIAVSSVSPRRSRPNGSTLGAEARRPFSSTGFVTPLIVSCAVPETVPSSASVELVGAERDLGIPLGVEEVRRLEMAGELLVLHVDARDARRAGEGRALEGGVEVAEAAAEDADTGVLDLERDVRVDGVCDPRGAGGSEGCGGFHRAHLRACLLRRLSYT
jgi:hypothetical protein